MIRVGSPKLSETIQALAMIRTQKIFDES